MSIDPKIPVVSLENLTCQPAKELYTSMKDKTGAVPKWMQVMANCEDTMCAFFGLFQTIMDNDPVNQKLKWKVAFRVSELNKCHYCIGVSTMKLESLGLTEEDIANIDEAADEQETAALNYAKHAVEHAYEIPEEVFEELKKHFKSNQIVEITSAVGLFNYINTFNDALGVLPDQS